MTESLRISRRQLGGLVLTLSGATLLRVQPAAGATGSPTLQRVHGQPYASNWFPADLVEWDPADDPDSPFMRSATPLAQRVVDRYTTANPKARDRRVLACSVFDHTDGNPAQGSAVFDYYTSEFWTYIDTLIFWGGSASEGLILAPNPTVVDAAHRNGVPVYGTLYFPPIVYGGRLQWVEDLLQKDSDGFPVARSLAAIAAYYGFEGWFFNQETAGADGALAKRMVSFLADVHRHGSRVLWYDAMTESGSVGWQGALNANNDAFFAKSDLMFVDFRWSTASLASSATYAKNMDREPDQLFAGIDTGSQQFGIQSEMDAIFPGKAESGVSVALYRPDFTLTGTADPTQYAERESRFWVGADGDPSSSKPDEQGWRGMSAEIAERASVTSLPFVTFFGTGHGHQFCHRGTQILDGDWNNLTVQDVLPTWRWLVEGADLTVDYDYAEVWQGGNSVRITGSLDQPTTISLYATRLEIDVDTALEVVLAGGVTLSAVLRFLDDPDTDVVVPMGDGVAGWKRRSTGPLAPYQGRTLIRVGVRIEGSGDVDVRLGELRLVPGPALLLRAPRHPVAERSKPGYRVYWRGQQGVRYDLEAVNPDLTHTWLGATTAEAFYVATLAADVRQIAIVPIGADGGRGPAGFAAV
jgi:endo-beta-N-acetylglucosaminidase D